MADQSQLENHELFSRKELEEFRKMLLEEKDKILAKAKQMIDQGNIHLEKDDMYDEVDLASATVDQNLTFKLLDRDRKLLAEVNHALYKIDNGEFGYCEGTGEPIPKRRLEVRPWCKYSVKFKEQLERRKKSGRGVGDDEEIR
jgi:DnaK suppressor protein